MDNLSNIFFLFVIGGFLLIAGWLVQVVIALSQGDPIPFDISNPLRLQARWPRAKKNIKEDKTDGSKSLN